MNKLLESIKNWYSRDKKVITFSIIAGCITTTCLGAYTKTYSDTIQNGIAKEVIRFHVLANSDSEEDQNLKIKVKDGVLKEFKKELERSEKIQDTRNFLLANINEIELCAEKIIKDNGYDYDVKVSVEKDPFPTKTYGDTTLPAGEYEALRIEIGDSMGKNWWCVMFPPLCFVDVAKSEIPEREKKMLKEVLTKEEYTIITTKAEKDIPIKVKFKIVEWWQEQEQKPNQKQMFAKK